MHMSVSISVVIPAYNTRRFIDRAIESVLRQTLPACETIVVDDGSSDGTGNVVANYPQVRYIRQGNRGAAAARNRGIAEARGEWIAFLDSDDEWLPWRLERQWALLRVRPDVAWASGAFERCRAGRYRGIQEDPGREPYRRAMKILGHRMVLHTCTMLIRRDILEDIGAFDESLRSSEDLDLWVRIAQRWPILAYVADPVFHYHVRRGGSLTANTITLCDDSGVRMVRKLWAARASYAAQDQEDVKEFCRRKLEALVHFSISRGKYTLAERATETGKEFGLEICPGVAVRKMRFPAVIRRWLWQVRRMGGTLVSPLRGRPIAYL